MPQGLEHPAVHVVPRRFAFGGSVEVNILCRASPEEAEPAGSEKQFLEDLEALRGCDVTDTIGWDIWEGATTKLCELLVACPAIVRGKRCVEIGAGVGVVGLVAAKVGAKSVLVTDYDAGALAIAKENIRLNQLKHAVTTAHYDFGVGAFPTISGIDGSPVSSGGEPYDIVLGSDLLYSSRMASLLHAAVRGYFRGAAAGGFVMTHEVRRSVTWGPDRTPMVEPHDSVLQAFAERCAGGLPSVEPAGSAAGEEAECVQMQQVECAGAVLDGEGAEVKAFWLCRAGQEAPPGLLPAACSAPYEPNRPTG